MRSNFGLVFFLLFVSSTAWAGPCNMRTLPEPVQSSLASEFAGWRLVTTNLLEASDRQTWLKNYARDCPGMIKGRFTGKGEEWVVNLLNVKGGKTRQELVYFQLLEGKCVNHILLKPHATSIVLVLRLFTPGKYRDVTSGRFIVIAYDTVGLSQIGSGTVVYYWDGATFRRIVTSE